MLYLVKKPYTKRIYIHLDNDELGIIAANMIASALSIWSFDVSIMPPPKGKGFHDFYMESIRRNKLENVALLDVPPAIGQHAQHA